MRKLLLPLTTVLLLGATSLVAQEYQPFTITGNLGKVEKGSRVRLDYRNDEGRQMDSATVVDGKFELKGQVNAPTNCNLVLVSPQEIEKRFYNPNRVTFYIEPTTIEIKGNGSLVNAAVTGSKTQLEVDWLEAQKKPVMDVVLPLGEQLSKLYENEGAERNKAAIDSLRNMIIEARKPLKAIDDQYILSHPNSYLSLDLLATRELFMDVDSFEPMYNSLSPQLRNSKKGESMSATMVIAKKTKIGAPAIDFAQATPAGNSIQLASLKGKYVLVDFWASWCGPCRAENPNLVKAYEKMKASGSPFEILAVSLDDKKERWEKAIADDQLTWLHVSDLKGWKNDVAVSYGVRAIPQNLLLNEQGIIIAKDLRGDELMHKLKELQLMN